MSGEKSEAPPQVASFTLKKSTNPRHQHYYVARFNTQIKPNKFNFQEMEQPIRMYKEGATEDLTDFLDPEAVETRSKVPWIIEDDKRKHCFRGYFEGGQKTRYYVFIKSVLL